MLYRKLEPDRDVRMYAAHVKRCPLHNQPVRPQLKIQNLDKHWSTSSINLIKSITPLSSDRPFTFGMESPSLNSGTLSKTFYLPPLSNLKHSPPLLLLTFWLNVVFSSVYDERLSLHSLQRMFFNLQVMCLLVCRSNTRQIRDGRVRADPGCPSLLFVYSRKWGLYTKDW